MTATILALTLMAQWPEDCLNSNGPSAGVMHYVLIEYNERAPRGLMHGADAYTLWCAHHIYEPPN